VFTFSFSGRFDRLDWLFYWADISALLALAPMLLHFTLVFPERGNKWVRTPLGARLLPLLYLPAPDHGQRPRDGSGAARRRLAPAERGRRARPDRAPLPRACLLGGLAVLVHTLAHARSVTARRQLRWIVWGTLLGGAPFALGYAVPLRPRGDADRQDGSARGAPRTHPAVVRFGDRALPPDGRGSDRQTGLVYIAAAAGIVALYAVLRQAVGWILAGGTANTIIAVLSTMVVVLLARPVKDAVQNVLDRAFYRDRYDYRRALVGFARDLSHRPRPAAPRRSPGDAHHRDAGHRPHRAHGGG